MPRGRLKILVSVLFSLFFVLVGAGQVMVCRAAVQACGMECHRESLQMSLQLPSSGDSLHMNMGNAEPCCEISGAPAGELAVVQSAPLPEPKLISVILVQQVFGYPSSPMAVGATHAYHSYLSSRDQPPIFILNRSLLI